MSEESTQDVPGLAFLQYVLNAITEDKDDITITATEDDLGILLSVRVSEKDMGKLIGKDGKTVQALKTLLRTIGGNIGKRVNLKILEPVVQSKE